MTEDRLPSHIVQPLLKLEIAWCLVRSVYLFEIRKLRLLWSCCSLRLLRLVKPRGY